MKGTKVSAAKKPSKPKKEEVKKKVAKPAPKEEKKVIPKEEAKVVKPKPVSKEPAEETKGTSSLFSRYSSAED